MSAVPVKQVRLERTKKDEEKKNICHVTYAFQDDQHDETNITLQSHPAPKEKRKEERSDASVSSTMEILKVLQISLIIFFLKISPFDVKYCLSLTIRVTTNQK